MAGILITVFFHLPLLLPLHTYQQQRELSKHAWGQELGPGNRSRKQREIGQTEEANGQESGEANGQESGEANGQESEEANGQQTEGG